MNPRSLQSVLAAGHGHDRVSAIPDGPPGMSRRKFLGRVAGGAGLVVGASLVGSGTALARPKGAPNPAPKPIPGGFTINGIKFHVTSFGDEPAVITDFQGMTGVADVRGTGTATNPDGSTETLLFDTDMRFFKGVYVAQDGRTRRATFGFV